MMNAERLRGVSGEFTGERIQPVDNWHTTSSAAYTMFASRFGLTSALLNMTHSNC